MVNSALQKAGKSADGVADSRSLIEIAGLDWDVEKRPLSYKAPDGEPVLADKSMIIRCDTQKPLGMVSEDFEPIQNRDVFKIIDEGVGEFGMKFASAGEFGGGQRVWAYAEMPESHKVGGIDEVNSHLVFFSNHVGSQGITVALTPIRVWCSNMITGLMRDMTRGNTHHGTVVERIRHTIDGVANLDGALRAIAAAQGSFAARLDDWDNMAAIHMTDLEFNGYLRTLIPDPKEGSSTGPARVRDEISGIKRTGMYGLDNKAVAETWWGGYNSITAWVDHSSSKQTETLAKNALFDTGSFGGARKLKTRALSLALSNAKGNA